MAALTIRYKEPVECTGASASWCPVCGDCTCPRDQDGRLDDDDSPTCPLHGLHSEHAAEPTEPPLVYVVTWQEGEDWSVVAVAVTEAMAKTICARNAQYRYEPLYLVGSGSDPWRPKKEDGT